MATNQPLGRRLVFSLALALFGTAMLDVLSSLFLGEINYQTLYCPILQPNSLKKSLGAAIFFAFINLVVDKNLNSRKAIYLQGK